MKTGYEGRLVCRTVLGTAACGCLAVLLLVSGCKKPVPVDREGALSAVKAADAAWSKAAQAHDMIGVMSYYADGATVLPPNQELVSNKPSIRKVWTDMLGPGTDLSWTEGSAEVSSSGDMVYDEGFYLMSTKVAKGKPVLDRGKYLAVWRKQDDGSWKAVADMWSSDLPPVAPGKKK